VFDLVSVYLVLLFVVLATTGFCGTVGVRVPTGGTVIMILGVMEVGVGYMEIGVGVAFGGSGVGVGTGVGVFDMVTVTAIDVLLLPAISLAIAMRV
jgi:hypothetical protein